MLLENVSLSGIHVHIGSIIWILLMARKSCVCDFVHQRYNKLFLNMVLFIVLENAHSLKSFHFVRIIHFVSLSGIHVGLIFWTLLITRKSLLV